MPGVESHLIVSDAGQAHDRRGDRRSAAATSRRSPPAGTTTQDIGAASASGSFRTDGMVIAPCSIKTAAAMPHCLADTLMVRAADVTLKEGRPLILAGPRDAAAPGPPPRAHRARRDGRGDPAAHAGLLQPPEADRRARGPHPRPRAGSAAAARTRWCPSGRALTRSRRRRPPRRPRLIPPREIVSPHAVPSTCPSSCPSTTRRRTCPLLWPEIREVLAPTGLALRGRSSSTTAARTGARRSSAGFRDATRACGWCASRPTPGRRPRPTPASRRRAGRASSRWTRTCRTIPHDIPAMLSHLERWDAVTGWRVNRADGDSVVRRVSSRVANRVRNALQRRGHPGQRLHVPRVPPRVPARARALQGLSSVHPDAAPDARVPRARGAGRTTGRDASASRSTGSATARSSAFKDLLVVRWMKDRLLRYEVTEDLGGDGGPAR